MRVLKRFVVASPTANMAIAYVSVAVSTASARAA